MIMRYAVVVILLSSASIDAAQKEKAGCLGLEEDDSRSGWLQKQTDGSFGSSGQRTGHEREQRTLFGSVGLSGCLKEDGSYAASASTGDQSPAASTSEQSSHEKNDSALPPDVQRFLESHKVVLTKNQIQEAFKPDGANIGIVFVFEQTLSEQHLVTVVHKDEDFNKDFLRLLLPRLNQTTPTKTVVSNAAANTLYNIGLSISRKWGNPWVIKSAEKDK